MLEIPESSVIAKQINDTIKGRKINNVYANSSPHKFAWYFGEPGNYHSLLAGKKIDRAKAYAGQVEIWAGDTRILFSDGVNVRYFDIGEKLPQKHQLHIEFDDLTSIVCSVQMYGGILAFNDGENDNPYYLVAKNSPSPLSSDFNEKFFSSLFKDETKKLSVKSFLATDQRIPGLGNGVLQDILFNAKIHPKRKMSTLLDSELDSLFHSVKSTLLNMTTNGGRDTEKDLFGHSGGYETILSKNTVGKGCPDCGTIIKKETYMGGSIYYCENCQRYEK